MSSPDIYSVRCWELSCSSQRSFKNTFTLVAAFFEIFQKNIPLSLKIMTMIVAAAFFFWSSRYTVFTVRFVAFFFVVRVLFRWSQWWWCVICAGCILSQWSSSSGSFSLENGCISLGFFFREETFINCWKESCSLVL